MSNYSEMMDALRIYREAMRTFVVDNLKAAYGDLWWSMGVAKHFKVHEMARLEEILEQRELPSNALPQNVQDLADMLDINHFKGIIEGNWKNVFRERLGKKTVIDGWIAEVDAARDPLAHWAGGDVDRQAALRFIDTCQRVASTIDKDKAAEIQRIWRKVDVGEVSAAPAPAKSALTGLSPWRSVIAPHPDVQQGQYVKAEFAAHLGEVHKGRASPEYGDPAGFFGRTFVTDGMRELLVRVVQRLRGEGGDPVIDLKTAFGGGKTHTMLAVYHLVRSAGRLGGNADVERIFELAGGPPPATKVAVIVGTDIDPIHPKVSADQTGGAEIMTIWGAIAWQLAGIQGYKIVEQHDAEGVAPGADVLQKLFATAGPSVILIDEFVAYLRNLPTTTRKDIPSGTFNQHMTFCQSLSEAVTKTPGIVLLVSVPESAIEYGDARGANIAEQIGNVFQRVGAPWQPVGAREAFEVVRRRLFGPILDAGERDRAVESFHRLYREGNDFPSECREPGYLEQMRASYPIHPEVFERLYEDWAGSIDRFQRTRGVLRLLADAIYRLWVSKDSDPMILPASLPMDHSNVRQQLVGYLGDQWAIPFDSDIDGESCEAAQIDRANARFGQVQACRRLARTILLGSVPGRAHQGLEVSRIMLGAAQPGEGVAIYGDALRALAGKLGYLWGTDQRYWFEVRANINRVAADRISRVTDDDAQTELRDRVRRLGKDRGDFAVVHAAPPGPAEVDDIQSARLVILGPDATHKKDDATSGALNKATEILDSRGSSPRLHRNMLVFLAADAEAVASAVEEAKRYRGWHSIAKDGESGAITLDKGQQAQAKKQHEEASATLEARLKEAYRWLLFPEQHGTEALRWNISPLTGGSLDSVGSLAQRASTKLTAAGQLIKEWSPLLLSRELDEWIWKDGRAEVGVKQLWSYFTTYLYFSRLRDDHVLLDEIRKGVRTKDYFAYADGVEGDQYAGLVFGAPPRGVVMDDASVLVRRDVAEAQLAAEPRQDEPGGTTPRGSNGDHTPGTKGAEQPARTVLRRFHGTARLNPTRLGTSAAQIGDEIVQHLSALVGADVEVTIEVQASVPDGIPEHVVRTISENARTLKFEQSAFEEE